MRLHLLSSTIFSLHFAFVWFFCAIYAICMNIDQPSTGSHTCQNICLYTKYKEIVFAQKLMAISTLWSSYSVLNFGSLSHLIRDWSKTVKKIIVVTSWANAQNVNSKLLKFSFWVKIVVILSVAQLVTTVILQNHEMKGNSRI